MKCAKCGSGDLIPDVTIIDSEGLDGRRPLQAVVDRHPEALIFKDRTSSPLRALICGACGHTEIHAPNHAALLRTYRTRKPAPKK